MNASTFNRAAEMVARKDWLVTEDGKTLHHGWLVAVTCTPDGPVGNGYYDCTAFAEWFAPAEHRNDGMRTTETAAEKGVRIGFVATAQALRDFAATMIVEG